MAEMSLSRSGPDLEEKLIGFARPFDVRVWIVGPTHLLGPATVWVPSSPGLRIWPGFGLPVLSVRSPVVLPFHCGGWPLIGLQIHPGPGHTRYIRYTGGPMPGSRVYQGPGYSTKPGTSGAQVYP